MRVSPERLPVVDVYPAARCGGSCGAACAPAGRPAPPRPPGRPAAGSSARSHRAAAPRSEGRLVPGHHEGDLIMGSKASNSAVATIVERTTGYLTLLHAARRAHRRRGRRRRHRPDERLPAWFARTLTWDRGTEIARHHASPPPPASRSTSPTPTRPGSAAATRTPTACSASTSPRAPTSAVTPAPSSRPSPPNSTIAPASASATTPPREEFARLLADDQRVATTP